MKRARSIYEQAIADADEHFRAIAEAAIWRGIGPPPDFQRIGPRKPKPKFRIVCETINYDHWTIQRPRE